MGKDNSAMNVVERWAKDMAAAQDEIDLYLTMQDYASVRLKLKEMRGYCKAFQVVLDCTKKQNQEEQDHE